MFANISFAKELFIYGTILNVASQTSAVLNVLRRHCYLAI